MLGATWAQPETEVAAAVAASTDLAARAGWRRKRHNGFGVIENKAKRQKVK
jgi:hypothetical protein